MSTLDNKLINLRGLKHTYNKILDKTVVVFDMSNYMSGNHVYDDLSGLAKADVAVSEYNGQKLSSTSINVGRDQFVITWVGNDSNSGSLNYFITKGKLTNGAYSITTASIIYAKNTTHFNEDNKLVNNGATYAAQNNIGGKNRFYFTDDDNKLLLYNWVDYYGDDKHASNGLSIISREGKPYLRHHKLIEDATVWTYSDTDYVLLTQGEKNKFTTKEELESQLQDITGSIGVSFYTKTESDNKYQPKGDYASKTVETEWNAFKSGNNNTQDVIDTLTEIQNYISSDIEAFAKLSETVNATANTVTNTIPNTYATKDDLNSYQPKGSYVETSSLSNTLNSYATKKELNDITFSVKEATDDDIDIIINSIK